MNKRKTLPNRPGWRWYKSEYASTRAEWKPARIKYFADHGLVFQSWNNQGNWSLLSNSKPEEWGPPIVRRKRKIPDTAPYRVSASAFLKEEE